MGRIVSMASGAGALFLQNGTANIHSVYKNTINLSFHESIYAIQPLDVWFTPMTVRVDRMPDGVVREGDCVFLNRSGMWIGEMYYGNELAECVCCEMKTGVGSRAEMSELLKLVKGRLSRTTEGIAPGFVWTGAKGEASGEAHEISMRGKLFLATGRLGEAAGEMCSMIGLGPGLTPSGDDFLIGLMAILRMIGEREFLPLLCGEIKRHLQKTNDISAAYLYHACHGEFSEPFHGLFSAGKLVAAVEKIASVGHSSGTDALAGIYFGVEQFGRGG